MPIRATQQGDTKKLPALLEDDVIFGLATREGHGSTLLNLPSSNDRD
jgi:hypothetical protein